MELTDIHPKAGKEEFYKCAFQNLYDDYDDDDDSTEFVEDNPIFKRINQYLNDKNVKEVSPLEKQTEAFDRKRIKLSMSSPSHVTKGEFLASSIGSKLRAKRNLQMMVSPLLSNHITYGTNELDNNDSSLKSCLIPLKFNRASNIEYSFSPGKKNEFEGSIDTILDMRKKKKGRAKIKICLSIQHLETFYILLRCMIKQKYEQNLN